MNLHWNPSRQKLNQVKENFNSLNHAPCTSKRLYSILQIASEDRKTIIYKEYTQSQDKKGTQDNPMKFEIGQMLVLNAFYLFEDTLYVYMGVFKEATKDTKPTLDGNVNKNQGWGALVILREDFLIRSSLIFICGNHDVGYINYERRIIYEYYELDKFNKETVLKEFYKEHPEVRYWAF